MIQITEDKKYLTIIGFLSVFIPLAVAILLFSPTKLGIEGGWIEFLPHLNGAINTATSIALVAGLVFIRQGKIHHHRSAMVTAFILGALFLVSYIIYHASADSTVFGDANGNGILDPSEASSVNSLRTVYLGILITHIILAAVVVPFVLLAFFFALTNRIDKHKKIVKFTYPIWLYVSVTGVVVYLMIKQYY